MKIRNVDYLFFLIPVNLRLFCVSANYHLWSGCQNFPVFGLQGPAAAFAATKHTHARTHILLKDFFPCGVHARSNWKLMQNYTAQSSNLLFTRENKGQSLSLYYLWRIGEAWTYGIGYIFCCFLNLVSCRSDLKVPCSNLTVEIEFIRGTSQK